MGSHVWHTLTNFYEFETNRDAIDEDQTKFFIEPAVGLSLGSDVVRFGAQLGIARPLSDPEDVVFDYQPAWFSLGLQLKVDTLLR